MGYLVTISQRVTLELLRGTTLAISARRPVSPSLAKSIRSGILQVGRWSTLIYRIDKAKNSAKPHEYSDDLATRYSNSTYNVTTAQLLSWNTNIQGSCSGIAAGQRVCKR